MKISKKPLPVFKVFFLMLMLLPTFAESVELEFTGRLLSLPCRIAPGMESQTVSFKDTALPIYNTWPGKSYTEKFQIKFINCQKSVMNKTLKLKFTGNEEHLLSGYLNVNGVNEGKLGIGIIDSDGSSILKLNHFHNKEVGTKIKGDGIVLSFGAFVQATPEAIASKSVIAGSFNATTTFYIMYE